MGYTIPSRTIIQTQAWTMHRVENVYYRPDEFEPDRWLHESDGMKVHRGRLGISVYTLTDCFDKAHFLPFGHGGRLCAGQK